jgi:membrane-bound metal-dependent hydrolase YbcI (DUF457 family)
LQKHKKGKKMPFTPLHFGISGTASFISLKRIDFFSCILSNVVIDIQPFIVIFLNINIPLHGVSHTFFFAIIVCFVVFSICGLLINKLFKIKKSLSAYFFGGILGGILHVVIDGFLYKDMTPFYPFSQASFSIELSSFVINVICLMGYISLIVLGIIYLIRKKIIRQKNK